MLSKSQHIVVRVEGNTISPTFRNPPPPSSPSLWGRPWPLLLPAPLYSARKHVRSLGICPASKYLQDVPLIPTICCVRPQEYMPFPECAHISDHCAIFCMLRCRLLPVHRHHPQPCACTSVGGVAVDPTVWRPLHFGVAPQDNPCDIPQWVQHRKGRFGSALE